MTKEKEAALSPSSSTDDLPPSYTSAGSEPITLEITSTGITEPSTGRALYRIDKESHIFRKTVIQYHNLVSESNQPYAVREGSAVIHRGASVKASDFLFSKGWLSSNNLFLANGNEYKFREKGLTSSLELRLASADKDTPPLAKFKSPMLFRKARKIIIYPNASATAPTTTLSHSLADDKHESQSAGNVHTCWERGQPTELLDIAIVAEAIYRANQERKAGAAAAASSSSSAAVG